MKRVGFASLLAAAVISMIMTSVFGTSFYQEPSSWLLIAGGLGAVGLGLIGTESMRGTTKSEEDTRSEHSVPS